MLKEGTLPAGYTVKKRKLVKVSVKKAGKKSRQEGRLSSRLERHAPRPRRPG